MKNRLRHPVTAMGTARDRNDENDKNNVRGTIETDPTNNPNASDLSSREQSMGWIKLAYRSPKGESDNMESPSAKTNR
ncbi:MAG TPA: hypothetical protein VFE98_04125 [Candidatus Bathyarchaeia archaeon]|nr:hypothetical protein [Candidatus Bathyarchaeia archaeon]